MVSAENWPLKSEAVIGSILGLCFIFAHVLDPLFDLAHAGEILKKYIQIITTADRIARIYSWVTLATTPPVQKIRITAP